MSPSQSLTPVHTVLAPEVLSHIQSPAISTTSPHMELIIPSPVPPTTFPKFKNLPGEVRAMIWKKALPEPQTVKMRFGNGSNALQFDFLASEFPTILHVSFEARKEALKAYTLAFHDPRR